MLATILLVEMSARPAPARALEWMAAFVLQRSPFHRWRSRGKRITLGPMQIRGAVWSKSKAIAEGRILMRQSGIDYADLSQVAEFWNGAGIGSTAHYQYLTALVVAQPFAQQLMDGVCHADRSTT